MLSLMTLAVVCCSHEPIGDDCRRFGVEPQTTYTAYYDCPLRQYRLYLDTMRGGLSEENGKDYCTLLYSCYSQLEDMANIGLSPLYRDRGARTLRELIGPVDYYFGRLPSPDGR